MKLTHFEGRLFQQLEKAIFNVTPGVQVQVFQSGKKVCDISVGQTYFYYDYASLTKIIFSVQTMIKAFDEGRWELQDKVKKYLSWFPHEQTRIIDLMNHSSGLAWWYPIYKEMDLNQPREVRREFLRNFLSKAPVENKTDKSVYSDVGYFVLGFIIEEFYQKDLLTVWNEIKDEFYARSTLDFHIDNIPKNKVAFYAPTETCQWRRKMLQGEVHDENTWSFGGLSTHSGLFGSIDDLGWYGLYLRSQLLGISKTVIKQKTAKIFATRSRPTGQGDWALGYMMPTPGSASCGNYFSPMSIGHTGFTGTSLWYDPTQDLIVAILSNRVFYGRENKEYLTLRPQIHNWVVEGLRRS